MFEIKQSNEKQVFLLLALFSIHERKSYITPLKFVVCDVSTLANQKLVHQSMKAKSASYEQHMFI